MTVWQKAIHIKIRQAFKEKFVIKKTGQLCHFAIRVKMKNRFKKLFVRPKMIGIKGKIEEKMKERIEKIYFQKKIFVKIQRYVSSVFQKHLKKLKVGQMKGKIFYLLR